MAKKLQEFQDYKIRDHCIRKFLSIQILDKVLQQRLLGCGHVERKSVGELPHDAQHDRLEGKRQQTKTMIVQDRHCKRGHNKTRTGIESINGLDK